MVLTKIQIVNSISDQIGFPKTHSSEIIETLLEVIKKSLESGDDVLISGFGKFCVREPYYWLFFYLAPCGMIGDVNIGND